MRYIYPYAYIIPKNTTSGDYGLEKHRRPVAGHNLGNWAWQGWQIAGNGYRRNLDWFCVILVGLPALRF